MRTVVNNCFMMSLMAVVALVGLASAEEKEKPAAETKVAQEAPPPSDVWITIDGDSLTKERIGYMKKGRFARSDFIACDRWTDIKLKAKEARRLGLDKQAEHAFVLSLIVDYQLSVALDERLQTGTPVPGEEEAQKLYNERRATFQRPLRAIVQHITVANRELAEKIIAEAKTGASFEKLLRTHSTSRDKKRRGRTALIAMNKLEGQLGPAVAEAVKTAKENDILGPLMGKGGFEVVKVIKVQPPSTTSFEDVKAQLQRELHAGAVGKRRDELMTELKAKANIVKSQQLLDLEKEIKKSEAPKPPLPRSSGEKKTAPEPAEKK